ncbi:MAG: exodeoxyribonuclease VII large subunit [Actinomycetia bacterium]|nr:exodeoxyribonuclease VII large subunit [Actinomycetes bacterium]
MTVRTWTVEQVCAGVREALAACFPDGFWVRGEIQGLRKSAAGHVYFDLVEPGASGRGTDAKVGVVVFRGPLRGIEAVLGKVGNLALADGLEVRIRGRLDYYAPQGRVQFVMSAIDPRHTLGQLAADRDAVLRELAAEGLLEANKQRRLPLVPLRVGLVTSRGSAAHHDFLHELDSSGFAFAIELAQTKVQGVDAHLAIVQAIEYAGALDVDVVAVVRGGGAKGDLIAFDHGDVARAIANCPIPVLVGVGHEIDRSIADEVAHSSLKTPTACAGALVSRVQSFLDGLDASGRRIRTTLEERLGREQERLDADTRRLGRVAGSNTQRAASGLSGQTERLRRSSTRVVDVASSSIARTAGSVQTLAATRLDRAETEMERLVWLLTAGSRRRLDSATLAVDHAASLVRVVHPARTLALGYSITRDPYGAVVRTVDNVAVGDSITVEVADGTIGVDVITTRTQTNDEEMP